MKTKLTKAKKENISKFALQVFIIVLAGVVGGIAFKNFFEAANIIPTGMSGLTLIIHNLLVQAGINFPSSVIYLIINLIIFLFALKFFGWKFLLLSGIGIASYTLSMQFIIIPEIAYAAEPDLLLYSIVGGMILGLAIGTALRFGGSTGGSEIAAALINKRFPRIKTGYCLLGINAIVIILSAITTGDIYIGLYALVVTIICSMAANLVLDDSKRVVALYIVCDKYEEISNVIFNKFRRGVTKVNANGAFSNKEKYLLISLIPKINISEAKKLIMEIEPRAFVYSSTVSEMLGENDFIKEYTMFNKILETTNATLKVNKKYNIKPFNKKEKIFKRKGKFIYKN